MKIGIFGCAGRMGKMLVATALNAKGLDIVAACESPFNPVIGKDVAEVAGLTERAGVKVIDNPREVFEKADVVIDFSSPFATAENAELAAEMGKCLVIGTTGLDDEQFERVRRSATKTAIVMAPNMSLGINILLSCVEKVASMLDLEYDIEVLEMHHKGKIDAPSGTALALGKAAAKGRGINLDEAKRTCRDGNIGKRLEGEIGFATLRGGDVVGDHTVIFAADGERIEFTHKASSREVFARGALRAALWLPGKSAGLYTMKDVLGL